LDNKVQSAAKPLWSVNEKPRCPPIDVHLYQANFKLNGSDNNLAECADDIGRACSGANGRSSFSGKLQGGRSCRRYVSHIFSRFRCSSLKMTNCTSLLSTAIFVRLRPVEVIARAIRYQFFIGDLARFLLLMIDALLRQQRSGHGFIDPTLGPLASLSRTSTLVLF
jgi:hypothetical protein